MTNRVVKFFETVGHDLKSIFTTTTWEQKTLSIIGYVEPFLLGILTLTDPAIEPIVAVAMAGVTTALDDVRKTVQQGTVAPGSPEAAQVTAALTSVKANLSNLLTDAHIKNSAEVQKITEVVNLTNTAVDTILADAPPSAVSA